MLRKQNVLFNWQCKLFSISIIFLSLGFNICFAQTPEVDSLRIVLSSSISDTQRYSLSDELSFKLENLDLNQSLSYAQDALEIAQKLKDKEREAKAHFNVGLRIYETSEREKALAYFKRSERIAEELKLNELHAANLMSIAKWYRYEQFDSLKCVQYFLKSVEISKATDYHYGTGRSYAKLASFYTRYNEIELCEDYLKLSAEYYMRIENGGEEIAHYYNEVGNKIWDHSPMKSMALYLKGREYSDTYPNIKVNLAKAHNMIGEPEIALSYLEEAIPVIREMEYNRMLGIAISQLAEVYIQLGDYTAASKACDEGIKLLLPLGRSNQRALPAIYRSKGIVKEFEGNKNDAFNYYKKSLEEATRIKNYFEKVKSSLIIGNYYLTEDIHKAKKFCKNSLNKAQERKYTNLEIEACDCLYNIYKKENSFDQALAFFERKILLDDSLSTLKLEHILDVSKTIAQKDKQIAEQAHLKEIKEEQLKNQYRLNSTLILSSIIGFVLIAFLSLSIKKIRNQNLQITKKTIEIENVNLSLGRSNQELERFAHVASHDLKSPLRNIISFTGVLRRSLEKNDKPTVTESLNFIESGGKRMSFLIDDILEYSKLSSQTTDKHKVVDLNNLVVELSELILDSPESKNVKIKVSDLPNLKWNYSKIFLLFKNLIENGLKYNKSEQPTVKIYTKDIEDGKALFFEDNGIGIKAEHFDRIFIMFQRLQSQSEYEGTGLGLASCKKIVEEFGGQISLTSEENTKTIFKIDLPNRLICQV